MIDKITFFIYNLAICSTLSIFIQRGGWRMKNVFLEERRKFVEKLESECTQISDTLSSIKFSPCKGSDPCDCSSVETAVTDTALRRKRAWSRLEILTKLLPALREWNGMCPCCKTSSVTLQEVNSTSSLLCSDCRIKAREMHAEVGI